MRAACSHARSPSVVSSACPAAACISRAASGVSASTTISGMSGDANRSSLGPVCTRNSRSLSIAIDRSSDGIACPSMFDSTVTSIGIAQDRRRLQRGAVLARQARDARRDQAAERLRQRELLPDELHRDDAPLAHRDRADLDEPLDDLLDEERMPAGARADEAHQLLGHGVDAEAQRDEALDVGRREVPELERDVPVDVLQRVREPGARGEEEDDARWRRRRRTSSSSAKLSSSIACATSHAKVCGRSSHRLCTMRAKAVPQERLRVAREGRDVRAERREHRAHLVALQAERAQARLHGEDAVLRVALGRAAEDLQHAHDARRAGTRCRAAGTPRCGSRRCSRPCAGAARPRRAGASCRCRGRRGW